MKREVRERKREQTRERESARERARARARARAREKEKEKENERASERARDSTIEGALGDEETQTSLFRLTAVVLTTDDPIAVLIRATRLLPSRISGAGLLPRNSGARLVPLLTLD